MHESVPFSQRTERREVTNKEALGQGCTQGRAVWSLYYKTNGGPWTCIQVHSITQFRPVRFFWGDHPAEALIWLFFHSVMTIINLRTPKVPPWFSNLLFRGVNAPFRVYFHFVMQSQSSASVTPAPTGVLWGGHSTDAPVWVLFCSVWETIINLGTPYASSGLSCASAFSASSRTSCRLWRVQCSSI